MATNLPARELSDSAAATKLYFGTYNDAPLYFTATEVAVTINFFEKRGFDKDAAQVTSTALLKQAKVEGVPITQVLDQLKGYNDLEISGLVAQILNNNRTATSTLGYRQNIEDVTKSRNIFA
jgi:hypothetical protein